MSVQFAVMCMIRPREILTTGFSPAQPEKMFRKIGFARFVA